MEQKDPTGKQAHGKRLLPILSCRYLYAQRKYGWNESEFASYLSFYRICYLVCLWLVVPFCTK